MKLFAILNWNIWTNKNDYRQLKNKINVDNVSAVRSRAGGTSTHSRVGGGGTRTHAHTRAHVHESHGGHNTGGQNSFLLSLGTQMRVSMVTWRPAGKRPHLDEGWAGRLCVHVVHVWLILFYTTRLFSSMHGEAILTGTRPPQTVAHSRRTRRGAARHRRSPPLQLPPPAAPSSRPLQLPPPAAPALRSKVRGTVARGWAGNLPLGRGNARRTRSSSRAFLTPPKKLRHRRNDGKLLDALILKSDPFKHTTGIISVSKQ